MNMHRALNETIVALRYFMDMGSGGGPARTASATREPDDKGEGTSGNQGQKPGRGR